MVLPLNAASPANLIMKAGCVRVCEGDGPQEQWESAAGTGVIAKIGSSHGPSASALQLHLGEECHLLKKSQFAIFFNTSVL